jgi:hypothetical protein
VGQFGGVGPVALWNCCPIAKGEWLQVWRTWKYAPNLKCTCMQNYFITILHACWP